MRIADSQLIAGRPTVKLRSFLKEYCRTGDFSRSVQTTLGLVPAAENKFLDELLRFGLLEKPPHWGETRYFILTPKGEAFVNASAAKPIHRKTAERVLCEFMERVHAVNATPEYLYRVSEVVLFGSMLTEVKQLGDVDVAVSLEAKVGEADVFEKWAMERRRAAQIAGRSFPTDIARICWATTEVYKQLKGKSRSLSLHEMKHVMHLSNLSYRVLLGDPEKIAAGVAIGRIVTDSAAKNDSRRLR
jgi:hypothetical protein